MDTLFNPADAAISLKGKDKPGMKHGIAVSPCVNCLSAYDNIAALSKGNKRRAEEVDRAYYKFQLLSDESVFIIKMKKRSEFCVSRNIAMDVLDKLSLSHVEDMLFSLDLTTNNLPNDLHFVLTDEPFHLVYLGVSKTLKECTVSCVSSSELKENPVLTKKYQKILSACKNRLLNGCNDFLRVYENDFPASGLQMDFSTHHVTSLLSGFFTTTGAKRMMKMKDFSALDMVFALFCAFRDRSTEYEGQLVLTKINTIYLDTVNELLYGSSDTNLLNWKTFSFKEKLVMFMEKEK